MARIHRRTIKKKILNDPDNHSGVITHPRVLESEAKWALGSITMNIASGGDGITAELSQVLKDDAVKVLHSTCQQIWKTFQSHDWKRLIFIPIPKKGNVKEFPSYHTIALISHASKQNSPSEGLTVCELRTSRC